MSNPLFNFIPRKDPTHIIEIQIGYDTEKANYWIKLINHSTNHVEGITMTPDDFKAAAKTMYQMHKFYSEVN